MSGNRYPSYLIHYGRSKDDGAPGVGTGNWRRGGGVFSSVLSKIKKTDNEKKR